MVLNGALTKIELGLVGMALTSPLALRFAEYLEHQPSLCPLQQLGGMTCPSCGGTRAVFYLWGADPIQAMKSNFGVTLFIFGLMALFMVGKIEVPAFRALEGNLHPEEIRENWSFFRFLRHFLLKTPIQ